ncbi:hypothetical protein GPUN_0675 [Glaciecola punicea ACAM 611]|uniref:Uncharacterized protein n=1 Tax=Glaciecola punicea ACAM 611 TaxID=1121923 RepID=H5T938_9ALTE|nr:hypothetical protein GPUN_0675 [Glaciecola punicea ACAM 611]
MPISPVPPSGTNHKSFSVGLCFKVDTQSKAFQMIKGHKGHDEVSSTILCD